MWKKQPKKSHRRCEWDRYIAWLLAHRTNCLNQQCGHCCCLSCIAIIFHSTKTYLSLGGDRAIEDEKTHRFFNRLSTPWRYLNKLTIFMPHIFSVRPGIVYDSEMCGVCARDFLLLFFVASASLSWLRFRLFHIRNRFFIFAIVRVTTCCCFAFAFFSFFFHFVVRSCLFCIRFAFGFRFAEIFPHWFNPRSSSWNTYLSHNLTWTLIG